MLPKSAAASEYAFFAALFISGVDSNGLLWFSQAVQCRCCGNEFKPKAWNVTSRDYRCPTCKRSEQNAANARVDLAAKAREVFGRPEVKSRLRAYHLRKRLNDPVYVLKRRARRILAYAIEKGLIVRAACQNCGTAKADGHHSDYSKPLSVQWLCRRCHFALEHRTERAK